MKVWEIGKSYPTVNGGKVRIISTDRASSNGKHWVGLYTPATGEFNGEWLITLDEKGTAYVFDTIKPDLSIKIEKRKLWILSYVDLSGRVKAEIWSAETNSKESIDRRIKAWNYFDVKVTLVEQ